MANILFGAAAALARRKQHEEEEIDESDVPRNFKASKLTPWLPGPWAFDSKGLARRRSLAERVHLLLSDPSSSKLGRKIILCIMVLIVVSCVSFCVETLPQLHVYSDECERCKPLVGEDAGDADKIAERESQEGYCRDHGCEPSSYIAFAWIEVVSIAVFTFEYAIRVVTAFSVQSTHEQRLGEHFSFRNLRALKRTVLFVVDKMNLIDLAAIVPFYVALVVASPTRLSVLRVLRLLRLTRLFKFGKFSEGTNMFIRVFQRSSMGFVILFVLTSYVLIVFGTLVYFAERGTWDSATGRYTLAALDPANGDVPSKYQSIPLTFWWVVVTLTTVGYGDLSPVSGVGNFFAVVLMYVGLVLMSMPITIIGANFADAYYEEDLAQKKKVRAEAKAGAALLNVLFQVRLAPIRAAWTQWKYHTRRVVEEVDDVTFVIRRTVHRHLRNLRLPHVQTVARLELVSQHVGELRKDTELNIGHSKVDDDWVRRIVREEARHELVGLREFVRARFDELLVLAGEHPTQREEDEVDDDGDE